MDNLNYHHLRYFREVARDGNLTRTAQRVNLSQSALSTQIRTLEERLGHPLFDRVGRRLVLTEVGRITLDHADRIFRTGEELIATLDGAGATVPPLRVGAISTLSRNFQMAFLRPALATTAANLIVKSGAGDALLAGLTSLSLDVVLTTEPPAADAGFISHRISEQSVGIHGTGARMRHRTLMSILQNEPLIIPTESSIRTGFHSLIARLNVTPTIAAEVDDMAMVRLLTREGLGVAIAPAVVFTDEIASGRLETAPFDLQIVESFYAVTIRRTFPHPLILELLASWGTSLDMTNQKIS